MINRLKLFMDSEGIIASQFADSIGIARSSFSQLMTGRNKSVNDVTLSKIHAAYPMLSIQWLLFGEGEMLVDGHNNASLTDYNNEDEPTKQLTIFDENGIFENGKKDDRKYKQETAVDNKPSYDVVPERENMNLTPNKSDKRRAVKVIVFYSDNTFECFIPE